MDRRTDRWMTPELAYRWHSIRNPVRGIQYTLERNSVLAFDMCSSRTQY